LVPPKHPRLDKVFQQPMSATSLRMLLRDPIRFVWRYALGWRQPEEAGEPFSVDPLTCGLLVHETLQIAVGTLEANGGLGTSTPVDIGKAINEAVCATAAQWEAE